MGEVKALKVLFMSGILLLAFLFLGFSVLAVEDSDSDGVLDSSDNCPGSDVNEELPILVQEGKYIGCSCSQILEMVGDVYCFDIFCASGRPLSVQERAFSLRKLECKEDYCVNATLYDFADSGTILCVDGKEQEKECNKIIITESEACLNGSILQYVQRVESSEFPDSKEDKVPILLSDYEKFQNRVYLLASDDAIIKGGLGISGIDKFQRNLERIENVVVVEKNTVFEVKKIGAVEKTISTRTIKIIPKKSVILEKLYVFEELPKASELTSLEILPNTAPILKLEAPVLLVWEFERVSEPIEISYQVNEPLKGESSTLIVAREVKSTSWKLIFIPLILILLFIGGFFYFSEKSVPRRKKIFK